VLQNLWFIVIAGLWTGYFVLEGFDFGVGILLPVLGRDDRERRVLINTIGPVWDGNEVWVITAGGGTFAAFPNWYASLFSGFYLALLLILAALIVRGVAFEFRGQRDDPRWRRRWDLAIFLGSLLPALLWGIAFANIVRGVALNAEHNYLGGLLPLLNPFALLGGVTMLALFVTHGAIFLALKTTGEIRLRARALAGRVGVLATLLVAGFLSWLLEIRNSPAAIVLAALAVVALVAAMTANRVRREGWAFLGTAAAIGLAMAALFNALYPDVLPSTISAANSLTVHNASASPYTLRLMSWVALAFTPFVLLYQGWTYWVFRRRIGVGDIPQGH
jgi:cytochrome d ubiquinol oxidase subunit II